MGKTIKTPSPDKKKRSAKSAVKHSSPVLKELMEEMKVESEGEPVQAWQKGKSIECAKA